MNSTVEQNSNFSIRKGGKYLTFALGREEYGLEILKVREIIGYMDVTVVPRTPLHVKGVINLRGQVISVVDLRTKFGMQEASRTEQTCIVVVDIHRDGRRVNIGVIVDRVSEVLNIAEDNTEDAAAGEIDTSFIRGMGKIGNSVKILLDIDKVLDAAEDAVSLEPHATEAAEPAEAVA